MVAFIVRIGTRARVQVGREGGRAQFEPLLGESLGACFQVGVDLDLVDGVGGVEGAQDALEPVLAVGAFVEVLGTKGVGWVGGEGTGSPLLVNENKSAPAAHSGIHVHIVI